MRRLVELAEAFFQARRGSAQALVVLPDALFLPSDSASVSWQRRTACRPSLN
jgi:hypothetical protein